MDADRAAARKLARTMTGGSTRVRSAPVVDDHDQHLAGREGGPSGTKVELAQLPRTEAPVQARPKPVRSFVPMIMNMEYLLSLSTGGASPRQDQL